MKSLGGRYSVSLGIDVSKSDPNEVFKWFIASILYGAPIPQSIAARTYGQFEKRGLLNVDAILKAGWDELVSVLDDGGYVRYDFKTADKLLEVMGNLKKEYGGDLNLLHERALNSRDLETRIKDLGKGVGDVTVNIFLRELRGVWEKAEPLPQSLAIMAAKKLGFTVHAESSEKERERVLADLRTAWERAKVEGFSFSDFESSLTRLAKDFCRKSKCAKCPVRERCLEPAARRGS